MISRLKRLPFLLYLHLILIGFAVSVIVFIILRQYTLVTGEHMIGLSILLAAVFLNIATGSRFFGRRSDRIGNVAGLAIVLEFCIALYAFANPLLLSAFEKTMAVLTAHTGTASFGVSFYRFMVLVIFMLPVTFVGGLIPVLSKYMIRHVSQVGKKTGLVFALTGIGVASGSYVSGIYMIPHYGYMASLMISSALLLINAGILWVHQKKASVITVEPPVWSMAMKARKSGMTVMKSRFVLETEVKLIRTLLWVFAIEGFAAMSFVILWTRSLSDLLKTSVPSAVSLVSVAVFTGLAGGSLVFKGLADRPRKRFYLLGLIEILTGITAALSFAGLYTLISMTGWIEDAAMNMNAGFREQSVMVLVLIFLPAFFLGASFPLACRLYPKRIQRIGRRIGWLGFVFLIGSMISLFLTSFIFIPLVGVYSTFFLFVIITILIGLILILRDSRIKRAFRMVILLLAVMLILLLQSIFRNQGTDIHAAGLMQQDTIMVKKEGSTASAMLIERTEGYNDLLINGNIVMKTDRANIRVQQLLAYLPWLFSEGTSEAYLGGFGFGATASALEMCGFSRIFISEPSPEVITLTASGLTEINNDVLTDQAIAISIEDSRSFLHRSKGSFDVITFSYAFPALNPACYTREFYELCKDHLAENGVLCQSLPMSWFGSPAFNSLLKTCSVVFDDLSLWHTGTDRFLLLAAGDSTIRDFCQLKDRFERLNADQKMTRLGFSIPEALLSCLVMDDRHIREMAADYPEFTDNMPFRVMTWQTQHPENAPLPDFSGSEAVSYTEWIDFSGSCVASERYSLNIIDSFKKILLENPGL